MNLDPPLLPSALGDQGDGHPMPAVPCSRVPIANPGVAPAVGIPSIGVPTANLGWQLFRTTAAQVVGRNFTSAARLVVAAIIFRSYGKDLFGAYALILAILSIAEYLLDFGGGEVFVREVCREPGRAPRLLRQFTATKLAQIPMAFAMLAVILLALRYPAPIVKAGLAGGAGLFFFAGVLIYRVVFRSQLALEREVLAELLSVVVMIPAVLLVARHRGGLTALVGCLVLSRAAFFGFCFLFGNSSYQPSVRGIQWPDVRWSLVSSATIGVVGLFAITYDTLDILLLGKLGSLSDLAYYSGAQKFVLPVVIALSSIGGSLYPVAASYWPHARRQFEQTCQRGLDTVFLIGGVAICMLFAGANFFMSLIGRNLAPGAAVVRVLAPVIFLKMVSMTLGPMLYVVYAQRQALLSIAAVTIVKACVIAVVAPRFGYMGVAYGVLGIETCFAILPIYLIRRFTGYRVQWTVPLRVIAITFAVVAILRLIPWINPLMAALAAPAVYTALAFVTGAASLSDVRWLLKWKTA